MNFEKVELYGFKSFADKAEIKFGNGITGIVGPNGCGKSNVADAIRWVLGEQSAKTLRGSSMQDVIFSGTQDRKSLSYCEVSLFFDNTNKMFSLDYNEVIITRKLFRSGESEYYINKQPARLKDIVDLLHECGIGKEGYSIIGQGKVEEIMSAKPEDRRMIFEEATGIAKNKARKNESERKLERTHENVLRYSDIITEIENQLNPLEKQAEKAKEFNELSEELKHHELNTYVYKVETVETTKAKYFDKIKGINEQTELRKNELNNAQKEYDKIFNDISEADVNLKKINEELLEKRVNMEQSSGAKKLFEQKISYLNSQIERSEKEIEESKTLIENSTMEKENCEAQKEQKEKENAELNKKLKEVTGKLLTLADKISLSEELSEENRKKIIESIENMTDIKVNKGAYSIEKSNLLDKQKELNEKIDSLSVKRDGIFNEKEKCDNSINNLDRAIFDLKNRINQKEEDVRNANEEVAKIDNSIYSLNTVIATLNTRDNFYRSLKDSYEGYAPAVKALLNKAKTEEKLKSKIKGVVAELIKSDKKYDIALETALAASAQNIVTENPDDAKFLIDYLKENKLGRITFLPISSVKSREEHPSISLALKENGALGLANEIVKFDRKFENIISNLLGNTLIVDTLYNATEIAKKYRFAFKIVSLDGDVFLPQGSITGGSRRQDTVGLLSGDRKIEENALQLKQKQDEMQKLKDQKVSLEQKRDKALDELSLLNETYNGKRQEIVVSREKLTQIENSLIEVGREIESTNDLIEEVKNRLEEVGKKYQSDDENSKKLEKQRSEVTESADKHKQEFDSLKQEQEKLNGELTEIQVGVAESKAKIESLKLDIERLENTIISAKANIEHLVESNENAAFAIENLRRDEEKIILSKEEQDYINSLRNKIENIEKQKLSLKENLNKNDELRQRVSEEIETLSEKKHVEEIALAKIDSDLEYLGQSVFEDYQETYETAVKQKEENYDVKFGESEIARIRKKRSSLGAINAQAIDDFKVLKERYEEMTTQREDLIKAEDDLKQAINTIKGEMLSQFDEGFKKINENFQRIFKELFGGGKAMLELDYSETDDKLEAGVEIIAEPPGKKLQKLSLLSGGEKALTAIAILFAILKLRPMPFCVLDEIEAALDEANVDRFATYLQKFSKETQFIVITHRKPTMEKADALFGVTMQEKGVSKTVSVKLSDISDIDSDAM